MMPCPKMIEDMRSLLPMLRHRGAGAWGRRHTTRPHELQCETVCPACLIHNKLLKGLLPLLHSARVEHCTALHCPPALSQPT